MIDDLLRENNILKEQAMKDKKRSRDDHQDSVDGQNEQTKMLKLSNRVLQKYIVRMVNRA